MNKAAEMWFGKCKMNNKGFTLLEVLTSFAVLAIVSVALLQMFVLSTKTNRITYDMEKAQALCVEISEIYKADPDDARVASNSSVTSASGLTIYTKYYDSEWEHPSGTINPDSKYKLQIAETKTSTGSIPYSYHPEALWNGMIDPVDDSGNPLDSNMDLSISNSAVNPDNLKITLSGGFATQSSDLATPTPGSIRLENGKAVIPILIVSDMKDKDKVLASSCNIYIKNTAATYTYIDAAGTPQIAAGVTADVYVADAPSGAGILVNASSGDSRVSYIRSDESVSTDCNMTVSAIRLSDGLKMIENGVRKHLVR